MKKVFMGSSDMRIHDRVKSWLPLLRPLNLSLSLQPIPLRTVALPYDTVPVSSAKKNGSRMRIRNKGGKKKQCRKLGSEFMGVHKSSCPRTSDIS